MYTNYLSDLSQVYFYAFEICLNKDVMKETHKICLSDDMVSFYDLKFSILATCSKRLEAHLAADHGGELYCKPCYGRNFGPKGYGFAGGAGTGLSMDIGSPTGEVPTE